MTWLKNLVLFSLDSFANNLDLCGPVTGRPCPGSPPFSPPPPFVPPPPISSPGELFFGVLVYFLQFTSVWIPGILFLQYYLFTSFLLSVASEMRFDKLLYRYLRHDYVMMLSYHFFSLLSESCIMFFLFWFQKDLLHA